MLELMLSPCCLLHSLPGNVFDQAKPDQKNCYQGQKNSPCVERDSCSILCLCRCTHFLFLCVSLLFVWADLLVVPKKEKPTHIPVSGFLEKLNLMLRRRSLA